MQIIFKYFFSDNGKEAADYVSMGGDMVYMIGLYGKVDIWQEAY